ncbi:MAG: DUF433 domain-containing protein [Calothrix sp. SM1_7_51]|nr:DUF433 domain-containing protein [Calothrix sp. SM1_7_51]
MVSLFYPLMSYNRKFSHSPEKMKNLLDYLEAGDSLEVFLEHFPSVNREQTIAVLELAKEMLTVYAVYQAKM